MAGNHRQNKPASSTQIYHCHLPQSVPQVKRERKHKKMLSFQTKPAFTPEYLRRLSEMMKMSYYIPGARKLLDSSLQEKIMLTLGKKQYELERDMQIREFIKALKFKVQKKPVTKIELKHRQYITNLIKDLPKSQDSVSKSTSDETIEKSSLENFMDEWLKDFHPGSISLDSELPEPEPEEVRDRSFDLEMFKSLKDVEKLRAPRYTPEKDQTKESILEFGDYKTSDVLPRRVVKKRRVHPEKQMTELKQQPKPVPESRYMMLLRKKIEKQKKMEEQKKMEKQKKIESKTAKPTKLVISRTLEPEVEKKIVLESAVSPISQPLLEKLEKTDIKVRQSALDKKFSLSEEKPAILETEKEVFRSIYRLPSLERTKMSVYKRISWPSPLQFLKQMLGLRVKDKLVATLDEETKNNILSERLHGGNPSLMLEIIKQSVGKVTNEVLLKCVKDFELPLNVELEKVMLKKINTLKINITNNLINNLRQYVYGEGALSTAEEMATRVKNSLENVVDKVLYGENYRVYDSFLEEFMKNSELISSVDEDISLPEIEVFISNILSKDSSEVDSVTLSLKNTIYKNLKEGFKDFVLDSRNLEKVEALINKILLNSFNELIEKQGGSVENLEEQLSMKMRSFRSSISKLNKEFEQFMETEGTNCTPEKIQEQMEKILFRVINKVFYEEKDNVVFDGEKAKELETHIDESTVGKEVSAQKIEVPARQTGAVETDGKKKRKLEDVPLVIDRAVKNIIEKRLEKLGLDSGKIDLRQFKLMKKDLLSEMNDFIRTQGENVTMEDIVTKTESSILRTLYNIKPRLEDIPLVIDRIVKNMLKERFEKLGIDSEKVDLKQFEQMKKDLLKEINDFIRTQGENCTMEDIVSKIENTVRKTLYNIKPRFEDMPLVIDRIVKNMLKERFEKLGIDSEKVDLRQFEIMKKDLLKEINQFILTQGENCTMEDIVSIIENTVRKTLYNIKPRLDDIPLVVDRIVTNMLKERFEKLGIDSGTVDLKQFELMKNDLLKEINDFILTQGENCTMEDIVSKIESTVHKTLYNIKPRFEDIPLVIDHTVKNMLKERFEKFGMDSENVYLKQFELVKKDLLKEINDFIRTQEGNCTMEDIVSIIENTVLKTLKNIKPRLEDIPPVIDHVIKVMLKERLEKLGVESREEILKKYELIGNQFPVIALDVINDFIRAQGDECTIEDIVSKIEICVGEIMDGVFGELQEIVHGKFDGETLDTRIISEETKDKMSKEEVLQLRTSFKNRVHMNVKKEVDECLRKGKPKAENVEGMIGNIQGMAERAMNEVVHHYVKDLEVPLVVMREKQILNQMNILSGNLTANIIKEVQNYIQERGDFTGEEIMLKVEDTLDGAIAAVFDDQQEAVFDNLLYKLLYHSKKLGLTEEEKETILKKTKDQTKKELRTALKSRIGNNLKTAFKRQVRKSILHVQNLEKVLGDIHCIIDGVMVDGVGTCMTDLNIPPDRVNYEQILDKFDASRRNLAMVIIRKVNELIMKRIMYRCSAAEFKNLLENIVDGALSMMFDGGEDTDVDKLLDELVLQATEKEVSDEKREILRPTSVEVKDISGVKEGKHSALLSNPVFLQKLYKKIDELLEAETLATKDDKSKFKAFIEDSIPIKYNDLRKETTMDEILAQRGFHRCVRSVKDVLKDKRGAGEEGVTIRPTPRIVTPRKKRQPVEPIIEETVKETVESFLASTKEQSRGDRKVSVPLVRLEIFSEDKTDNIILPKNSIFSSEELRIFIKSLTVGKSYAKAKQSIAKKLSSIVPLPPKVLESVIDGCARGSSVVKMCSSA